MSAILCLKSSLNSNLSLYPSDVMVLLKMEDIFIQILTLALETKNFASRFVKAIEIANNDIHRAVTHNKGIMNGVDAVAIAT